VVIVRVAALPSRVKGVTVPDEDGNYNVYLNKCLSYETQRRAYLHEIEHITNDDFNSYEPARYIEERTNRNLSTL
jgi:hypothetical protein